LVVPLNLAAPEQEDAAQHHVGYAFGMLLGVGQGERAAPRSAEQLPSIDTKVLADALHVVDQVPSGVIAKLGVWCASAAAPLVEEDDAVHGRVPEAAMHGVRTAARPSMHENRRLSLRIAALLVVHRMDRIDPQVSGVVRLDVWK
jgi:hypothetical protein